MPPPLGDSAAADSGRWRSGYSAAAAAAGSRSPRRIENGIDTVEQIFEETRQGLGLFGCSPSIARGHGIYGPYLDTN